MKSNNILKSVMIATGISVSVLLCSQSAMALNVTAEVFQETKNPWGMSFLKDGTLFFTEKCDGLSVRLPSGSVNKLLGIGGSKDYPAVRDDLFCDGQAGMLGVEVSSMFAPHPKGQIANSMATPIS
jgi:glucose/arabinose dehydrogenase